MSDEINNQSAPIEFRAANVDGVNFSERIITVVAVPYGKPANVMYRNEIWHEFVEPGAFDGVAASPHRVRANRDHDGSRIVGKAVQMHLTDPRGLIAEIKIAKTVLGDETLALADDECLSSSIGFRCAPSGYQSHRPTMTRRIKSGYLDHIAFVANPAYPDAEVISVRLDDLPDAATLDPLHTPELDRLTDDPLFQWVHKRLNSQ